MLQVTAWGSFRAVEQLFKAQGSGHTVAVDDAITLLGKMRKEARAQDLKLRAQGHAPDDNFAEADKRGLIGDIIPVNAHLTSAEHRILYKLLWTAEAYTMDGRFRAILEDEGIIPEAQFTHEEIGRADDILSSLIRKLGLSPPQGKRATLPHESKKELGHDGG